MISFWKNSSTVSLTCWSRICFIVQHTQEASRFYLFRLYRWFDHTNYTWSHSSNRLFFIEMTFKIQMWSFSVCFSLVCHRSKDYYLIYYFCCSYELWMFEKLINELKFSNPKRREKNYHEISTSKQRKAITVQDQRQRKKTRVCRTPKYLNGLKMKMHAVYSSSSLYSCQEPPNLYIKINLFILGWNI